jgi:hypothetical protein
MISELNGNLVVRFTDYSTHEPFLSFLGTEDREHTARTLMRFAEDIGMPASLQLVPETSIKGMRASVVHVGEDENNFDYIYSISDLSRLGGNKFMSKRGSINRFKQRNPDAHIETIELSNKAAQLNIFSILDAWERNKLDQNKEYEIEHERIAIKRLCGSAELHALAVTGLFSQNTMLGFSIDELLPTNYCTCHFWKADSKYRGAFDFLMQEKAKHLATMGVEFVNYEQDLGIHALRTAKRSWRPVSYLKKYIVSMR